jgi:hypothetical protein
MDPYLEAPSIWPDFHDAFAAEIRGVLNRVLPAPYYARLEMRPEVEIVEDGGSSRRNVPDVAVARPVSPTLPLGGTAPLEQPRTTVSPSVEVKLQHEPLKHAFVEIRDPSQGHHLISLIEIASPSNKRPGVDRQAYIKKQREVLDSDASLIEIDLLRGGQRLFADPELETFASALQPPPDYLVLVNRGWRRLAGEMAYEIFPALLADPLPCIPVPLRQGEREPVLDLQFVMSRAYDSGPYLRGAVDYSKEPEPPLPPEKATWAAQCLQALKSRR